MMRQSRWWLTIYAFAFCLAAQSLPAQSPPARIMFELESPGESPPHYWIELGENGDGKYQAASSDDMPASNMTFHLQMDATSAWFAEARALHFFNGPFEARRKVAFSGRKTLRYEGPDGAGKATLNYTENKQMNDMVSNFLGIALTLQLGQRLETDARFHRIGLDVDMVAYKDSLKNHLATHPEIIAPILQRLVTDPEVMTRVQRDASSILQSTQ